MVYPGEIGHFYTLFTTTQYYTPDRNLPNGLVDFWLLFLGIRTIPSLAVKLVLDNAMQLLCVAAVFKLTTCFDSFTSTMVLTVRKFLSLLISIFYFAHPFTAMHWLGTVVVFVGILAFTLQDYVHEMRAVQQLVYAWIMARLGYAAPAALVEAAPQARQQAAAEEVVEPSQPSPPTHSQLRARARARQMQQNIVAAQVPAPTPSAGRRHAKKSKQFVLFV